MQNQVKWDPSESILPMKSVNTGSFIGGLVFILFGVVLSVGFIYIFIGQIIQHGFNLNAVIMLLIFMIMPLISLLIGLCIVFQQDITEITPEKITYTSKGLFERKEWQEPISNYDGVYRTFLSNSKNTITSSFLVRLRHKNDSSKNVSLFWSPAWSEDVITEALSRFSRLLNVSILFDGRPAYWQGVEIIERKPTKSEVQNLTYWSSHKKLLNFVYFCLFVFVVFPLMLFFIFRTDLDAICSIAWPSVDGKVVISKIEHAPSTFPIVFYTYTVSGINYTSGIISFVSLTSELRKWNIEDYAVGKIVKVFYRPSDPKRSVLEPGIPFKYVLNKLRSQVLLFMVLFFLIYISCVGMVKG